MILLKLLKSLGPTLAFSLEYFCFKIYQQPADFKADRVDTKYLKGLSPLANSKWENTAGIQLITAKEKHKANTFLAYQQLTYEIKIVLFLLYLGNIY